MNPCEDGSQPAIYNYSGDIPTHCSSSSFPGDCIVSYNKRACPTGIRDEQDFLLLGDQVNHWDA